MNEWIKKSVLKNYSLVYDFIIFGSPASSKNSRSWTGSSFVLGKQAQKYCSLFDKQIIRILPKINIPITDRDLLWLFEIYYNRKSSDASIELLFDLLQKHYIVQNDNVIRNYLVLAGEQREVPLTNILIYKRS